MGDAQSGLNVLLAVSGSIAAYRAADIVSLLRKRGHRVQCLMTANASHFVTRETLETLSENPVRTGLFDPTAPGTEHIALARWADVFVVAPATANIIARLALGLADDQVTTVALATRAPWVVAPAMNTVMWNQPVTQQHVATLRSRGVAIVQPEAGALACGEVGEGRLASPETIVASIEAVTTPADLAGWRLLVTSGPTTSAIDAVRYLTNRSTGRMGAAIVEEAVRRGAEVRCVLGVDKGVVRPRVSENARGALEVAEVHTAEEMRDAALQWLPLVDGVIACAAVLDYRVAESAVGKLKRADDDVALWLTPSVDVLRSLRAESRPGQWFCAFAAETDDVEAAGRAKLAARKVDYLFVNRVARLGETAETGFAGDTNAGMLFSAAGEERVIPLGSKAEVARAILDAIKDWRHG